MFREADPMLRRVERDACVICLACAAAGLAVPRGGGGAALGVLGGGALAGASYWAIKSAIDTLVAAAAPPDDAGTGERRRRIAPATRAAAVVKLAGRYALLAFFAYVMIARLRLHPIGLLTGASSIVAAVALEAARTLRGDRR
jgi:hypothetical protein